MPPQAAQRPGGPRLVVARGPADGLGDQYQISLWLDDQALGELGPGEVLDRPIAAGAHRLRASNTLMRKTVEFVAQPDGNVRFATRNRAGLGTTLFAALGAGWLYVVLEREVAVGDSRGTGSAESEVEIGGDARI
jgi:hypothetical protein